MAGFDPTIVEEHCVPESVLKVQGYGPRYDAAVAHLETHDVSATEISLESDGPMKTTIMEILSGWTRNEKNEPIPSDDRIADSSTVTLATIDGKPFAGTDDACHLKPGIKIGQRSLDAWAIGNLEARGGSVVRYAKHGAQFTVPTVRAVALLNEYGWRVAPRRYDARGKDHQFDRWLLYEVGGPLEAEVLERFSTPKKRK